MTEQNNEQQRLESKRQKMRLAKQKSRLKQKMEQEHANITPAEYRQRCRAACPQEFQRAKERHLQVIIDVKSILQALKDISEDREPFSSDEDAIATEMTWVDFVEALIAEVQQNGLMEFPISDMNTRDIYFLSLRHAEQRGESTDFFKFGTLTGIPLPLYIRFLEAVRDYFGSQITLLSEETQREVAKVQPYKFPEPNFANIVCVWCKTPASARTLPKEMAALYSNRFICSSCAAASRSMPGIDRTEHQRIFSQNNDPFNKSFLG